MAIRKLKIHILFLISLASLAYSFLVEIVFLKNVDMKGYKPKNIYEEITITIILGPFIETLIFQAFIFYIVRLFHKWLNNKFAIVYIIISSLAFAFAHIYSLYYVAYMILPGCLLAYMFYTRKRDDNSPVLSVYLIHLFYNTLVTLANHL